MAKKNYDELANQIIALIGSKENVISAFHCITRLRFHLKDKDLVEIEKLKDLKGVLGAQWSGDQLQVIIGNDVSNVYNTLCKIGGFESAAQVDENLDGKEKKKFSINTLFNVLSSCMVPALPALCAAGIVKGVLILCTTYLHMSTGSGLYTLLNTLGDVAFYFMPFLVANSTAKYFKTNTTMALLLAALFLHPNITALANQSLNVLGVNIHILNYSSTVFPILLSVWVMSYVYKFIDTHCPNALKFVLTPSLTLIVMAPICLGIIGPLGYYIGLYLATGVQKIFYFNTYVGGLVLGIIRPFVLLTGMQTTFTPIILNNLSTLGYDFIWPVHCIFAMCCVGVSVGSFLKAATSKKAEVREQKDNFLSSAVSAFAGVSEPTLYGNVFRFKRQMIGLMISGGISGALCGGLGGHCVSAANPPWLFLVQFGDTAGLMGILFIVAFVLSTVVSFLMGFDEKEVK